MDPGECHSKDNGPLSGFPSLVLQLPIAILISYSFSHIYANTHKSIHTPKTYTCTHTHHGSCAVSYPITFFVH